MILGLSKVKLLLPKNLYRPFLAQKHQSLRKLGFHFDNMAGICRALILCDERVRPEDWVFAYILGIYGSPPYNSYSYSKVLYLLLLPGYIDWHKCLRKSSSSSILSVLSHAEVWHVLLQNHNHFHILVTLKNKLDKLENFFETERGFYIRVEPYCQLTAGPSSFPQFHGSNVGIIELKHRWVWTDGDLSLIYPL